MEKWITEPRVCVCGEVVKAAPKGVPPPPHTVVRGAHRNPTNPWCSRSQGLPTSLNISTNRIIYPPIPSSLCNLAIPDSSQNQMKNYSIRVSTKIQLYPEAEQMPTDDRDICWGGVSSHGFHLSPVPAWTRLDLRCSESFYFEILVLGRGNFGQS